jgi:hypothetical protein
MVAAFCRAVLSHIIPSDFWGGGHVKKENERVFYRNVDQFIGLRRFEIMSLHEVSQGIKVRSRSRGLSSFWSNVKADIRDRVARPSSFRKQKNVSIRCWKEMGDIPRIFILSLRFLTHSSPQSQFSYHRV